MALSLVIVHGSNTGPRKKKQQQKCQGTSQNNFGCQKTRCLRSRCIYEVSTWVYILSVCIIPNRYVDEYAITFNDYLTTRIDERRGGKYEKVAKYAGNVLQALRV